MDLRLYFAPPANGQPSRYPHVVVFGDLSHLPNRAVGYPNEPLSGHRECLILPRLGSGPLPPHWGIYGSTS
jgi:hypothetical protein